MNPTLRIVSSANWLIGSLALAAAFLVPLVQSRIFVAAARAEAEKRVDEIVRAQKNYIVMKEKRAAYFSTDQRSSAPILKELGVDLSVGGFVYDASMNDRQQLVVRAFTSRQAVQSGALPPMFYQRTVLLGEGESEGKWEPLTDKQPGLHNLF
ncbi:MAG TPA: hypothetical protein PKZ97_00275 [Azospirillaceae bacterium]|mgnify:CR=1 FL=1|nr:hypothetical protein [Azospirillaceae bacterium]HRQ79533.1 hypothetical protein [Azospirillaceae bacterium]